MSFKIRHAHEDDIPTLIHLYFAAFQNDLDTLYFLDTTKNRTLWAALLRKEINDPEKLIIVAFEESSDGDQIVIAWASWELRNGNESTASGPGSFNPDCISRDSATSATKSEVSLEEPDWDIADDVNFSMLDSYLQEKRACHSRLGWRKHWCKRVSSSSAEWYHKVVLTQYQDIELVATSPGHQGRGAGTLLIREGLRIADDTGLEVYLEASPLAIPLYKRFGFVENGDLTLTALAGTRRQVVMIRSSDTKECLQPLERG